MLLLNRAWCSLGALVPPSTDIRTLLRFVRSSCRRNHCSNRTGYSLGVLVNALQSLNALQSYFNKIFLGGGTPPLPFLASLFS